MKTLKNENGATFVLTLITIGLTLLFILVLSTHVSSAIKQSQQSQQTNSAEIIAKSGIDYFEGFVTETIHQESVTTPVGIYWVIEPIEVELSKHHSFKIDNIRMNIQDNTLRILYTSTGTVHDKQKAIDQYMTITFPE